MGGRTDHVGKCPECLNTTKDLIFDKRDMKLKCETCYKKPVVKQ